MRAPRSRLELPAQAIAREVSALHARGRSDVRLTWATRAGPTTITRPLRTLGAEETLFFFGLYSLIGVFVVWSGLAVLMLAGRRAGAAAYAGWSVSSFVFMVTFFDYHSTAVLSPLFSLSTVCVSVCVVWLAYSFPEPPRKRGVVHAALVAFSAGGAVAAVMLIVGPFLGMDLRPLRLAIGVIAFAALLVLSATILFRLRAERGRRRQELRSSALGLAVVPALLGLGFLLPQFGGSASVHLVLPFLAPLLPLSVGYSLIRHNVLETNAVLTRRMFVVPVLTSALVVAIVAWLGLRAALHSAGSIALVPWLGAGATLVVLVGAGFRASSRLFFVATARFRPTLQQLADDLASKGNATDLASAIQSAVIRWLPTEGADVLSPADLDRLTHRPDNLDKLMEAGTAVWTTEPHWRRHLLVPMRSQGGLRGVLMLAPKHEAALYTREDLELLETIASLGAVALHNAEVFAELEAMRRLEADVARDDKRLTLGLLGAEVSHEIAYPLNFLRYLLREGNGGAPVGRARSGGGARGDRPPGADVRDAAPVEDPGAAPGAGAGAAPHPARDGPGARDRRDQPHRHRDRRAARSGGDRGAGPAGADLRQPAPQRGAGGAARFGGRRPIARRGRRRRRDGAGGLGRRDRDRGGHRIGDLQSVRQQQAGEHGHGAGRDAAAGARLRLEHRRPARGGADSFRY